MVTTSKKKIQAQVCKELRKKNMIFAGQTGEAGVNYMMKDHKRCIARRYTHLYCHLSKGIVELVEDGKVLD